MPEQTYYHQIISTVERKIKAYEDAYAEAKCIPSEQTADLIHIGKFVNALLKGSVQAELEAKAELGQCRADLTLRTAQLTIALQLLSEGHQLEEFQKRFNTDNPNGPLVLDLWKIR